MRHHRWVESAAPSLTHPIFVLRSIWYLCCHTEWMKRAFLAAGTMERRIGSYWLSNARPALCYNMPHFRTQLNVQVVAMWCIHWAKTDGLTLELFMIFLLSFTVQAYPWLKLQRWTKRDFLQLKWNFANVFSIWTYFSFHLFCYILHITFDKSTWGKPNFLGTLKYIARKWIVELKWYLQTANAWKKNKLENKIRFFKSSL